jgi:hypothetical protein
LLHADSRYLDFSSTQYAGALAWLIDIEVIARNGRHLELRPSLKGLTSAELRDAAFRAGLEASEPAWLRDADLLVRSTSELPSDATKLSTVLEVVASDALVAVRQVCGKIDLETRAKVGLAGERGVVKALNEAWPGAAQHVALESDGLGYDVSATAGDVTWHLEIKSTTRRGRLILYLSRQEFEMGKLDPRWQLVVAGLGLGNQLAALATVRRSVLSERAPVDQDPASRWETARYELGPSDLKRGLDFLPPGPSSTPPEVKALLENGSAAEDQFEWMPPRCDEPQASPSP